MARAATALALLAASAHAQDADELRAQRMAEDRARYESLVAAIDRFGHLDEFAQRMKELLAKARDRWVQVDDGYLTDIGCQSWLAWNVKKDGVYTFPESDPEGHPFDVIVDVNRQLRERGIDFLLVTFPTRGQLYPELFMELPSDEGFAGFCPATARFALALIDAGVEVQYLAPEFVAARQPEDPKRGALYLKYNQHWAPRAAELAARHIAERVRRFPWFEAGKDDAREPNLGKAAHGEVWLLREDERDVPVSQGGSPPDAKPERFLITRVVHPELRKLKASILPSSPITLFTGSFGSFHNFNECDFTSHLFRFLETPIHLCDPKGGIEDACRYEFASESDKLKAKKKLVIWMLPESVFKTGAMWQKVDLFPKDDEELSTPGEDRRRARKAQREPRKGDRPQDDGDEQRGAPAAMALPPQHAPAGATPPAEPASGESEAAARRAERLARERSALEAELAAVEAFGRETEFRDALRALARSEAQEVVGKERWIRVASGWLPLMAIDHWLEWHQPRAESAVPLAIDFDVPQHPLPAIVDFSRQLHEHDVELVVAVFPSRVQLYPELVLPGLEVPEEGSGGFRGMVGATTRFLLALNEHGVETVHLATPFAAARRVETPDGSNGEIYLRGNKHWTPRGAELAAQAVAERIREMPCFTPGPIREGADFVLERRVKAFTSQAGGQSPERSPEKIEMTSVFHDSARPNPKDERRSPIVVLSDSFAKFYSEAGDDSSFVDHLRRFTGWPIDAITPMGGAELQSRDVLMRRGDDLRGKQVVVWLLHEDNLRPRPAWRTLPIFSAR